MNICYQLKYWSEKEFFRFCLSPSYPLWPINGDSIFWLSNFHQKRRTLCEDMEVMRFSFWQRRRGKKRHRLPLSSSPSISLRSSAFYLISCWSLFSAVARPVVSVSIDQCCSTDVWATVRSRILLAFTLEISDPLNPKIYQLKCGNIPFQLHG